MAILTSALIGAGSKLNIMFLKSIQTDTEVEEKKSSKLNIMFLKLR